MVRVGSALTSQRIQDMRAKPRPDIGTSRCAYSCGLPTETDMDDTYTVADFILDILAWVAAVSIVGAMAIFGPIFFGA